MSSAALSAATQSELQRMLVDRRERLSGLLQEPTAEEVVGLLEEIDSAIDRIEQGRYGLCRVCEESFTEAELLENPLASYCLCHLSPERLSALGDDLQLAWQVQAALLPDPQLEFSDWQASYRYIPLGAVSGDYCDLMSPNGDDGLFFVLGDVSGKGVAASLLMSHMHGAFRTLIPSGCTLSSLLERINKLLLASTLSSQYVTLVCGCGDATGTLELVNAGHCQPVLYQHGEAKLLTSTHPPLGITAAISASESNSVHRVAMEAGDILFLYSDGLTEASDEQDCDYGTERLLKLIRSHAKESPQRLIALCLDDLADFLRGVPRQDDLTLMAIRRAQA